MTNKNSTDSTNKQSFTLQNIKDTLLESFDSNYAKKIITITGNVSKEQYTYLTDTFGNKLRLYFPEEDSYAILDDNDTITIKGFLNYQTDEKQDNDRYMYNSCLEFWFFVKEIEIENKSQESKIRCLERELANKPCKPATPTEFLSELLYKNKKPKLYILCTDTVKSDILQGLSACKEQYILEFEQAPLSRASDADKLTEKLKELDKMGYDAVVVARGGNESFDIFLEHNVYSTIINMKSYILAGIGHAILNGEFLKIFDHVELTPNEFGHYLQDLVKSVEEKRKQELYLNILYALAGLGALVAAYFLF